MTRLEKIASLYISIFGREPTIEQLEVYAGLNENIPLETISTTMFASDAALSLPTQAEALVKAAFQATFGYSTDEINKIISDQAAIGAAGGVDGFMYWVNELNNNPFISYETIFIAILNGAGTEDEKKVTDIVKTSVTAYETWLIQNDFTIKGTDLNDYLNGTELDNIILGLDGNDTILTGIGNNTVEGGLGSDTIYADIGDDIIYGNEGTDTIYAGAGNDTIYGNDEADYIHGEAGDDTILGGLGDDYLYGEDGNDFIDGNEGADTIDSGAGDNIIYGGDGNDIINLGLGKNVANGGDGNDIIYGNASKDEIYGGAGNDILYGYAEDDKIDGLSGDDLIYGGAGKDLINGNEDNDTIYAGEGDDTIFGESGNDILVGGAGLDIMTGGAGSDIFVFNKGDSLITSMDFITDFSTSLDTLRLVKQGTSIIESTITDVSSASTITEAINIASSADGSTNALIKWFIFDDNTYLVEDMSSDSIFTNNDLVIKLQGVISITNIDFEFI